jgi:transcription elongation factor Elf1
MWLVSIEPDKTDFDRRTFECPRCQEVKVVLIDLNPEPS